MPRATNLALLAVVIGLVVIGLSRSGSLFSSASPASAPASVAANAAGSRDGVARAGLLVADDLSAGGPGTPGGTPGPGVAITSHQWETSSPGIITDAALASRLNQALAGIDGHVSVAVEDLGSRRGAVLDGDREMASASLYKLPVLYTVFAEGLGMNEELPITEDARSYDAGTMELGAGETLTVAEALERMVTLSDNTAAVMLGARVGSERVNASIATLGMETTHYSLDRMTTSARDMLHFVDLLANGKLVSPSASADMLHLLLRQRVNDRLPRFLPDDVQVAHKTGNLPGTVNDVGILYGSSSTVAVAALVSDTSDEAIAATGIARLAEAAYTYFQEQPPDANRPLIPPAPDRPIPPVWREPRPVPTSVPRSEVASGGTPASQNSLANPAALATPGIPGAPETPGMPSAPATPATPAGLGTPGTSRGRSEASSAGTAPATPAPTPARLDSQTPGPTPPPALATAVHPLPASTPPPPAPTSVPAPPLAPIATPVPPPAPTPTPLPPRPTAGPTRAAPPATPTLGKR